jgi:hypothetical protein
MKINKNDIESSIIEKINQFDSIIDNFSDEDRSGFLAFNGNKFYIKRTSDVFLKKILSEEDLNNYKSHLYLESGLLKNSFRTNINTNNQSSNRFKSLIVKPVEDVLFKFTSDIVLHKEYLGSVYVFTEKGFLIQYSLKDKKSETAYDLLGTIKKEFSIQNISVYDFISIEAFEGGVLLGTRNDGVFFYDPKSKKLEVKFAEQDVVLIKYLGNDLFVLGMDKIDANIAFYNISGMRIEVANSLKKKLFQMPHLIDSYNGNLFVVGRPYSLDTTKDIVHYWKKDLAGLSYNNLDGKLFPGYDNKNYKPKYITVTESHLYISGLKDNKVLFIWQYDINDLQKPFIEFSFDKFSFEKLSYVDMNEKHFVAAETNNVYFMDIDGKVERNISLNEEIKSIFLTDIDDEFIYITNDKIISVKLPKHTDGDISLNVYSGETNCNNIDIYIKSSTGKEKIVFLDADTLMQIAPFYYGVYNNDIIIKLLGSTSLNILMKIGIPEDSEIEGIVINPNRLFMK